MYVRTRVSYSTSPATAPVPRAPGKTHAEVRICPFLCAQVATEYTGWVRAMSLMGKWLFRCVAYRAQLVCPANMATELATAAMVDAVSAQIAANKLTFCLFAVLKPEAPHSRGGTKRHSSGINTNFTVPCTRSCGCNILVQHDTSFPIPKEVSKLELFKGDIQAIITHQDCVYVAASDGALRAFKVAKTGALQMVRHSEAQSGQVLIQGPYSASAMRADMLRH